MKKYAVIVAGGSGLRMESALPKQFLLIHQKPVIWYTINTFFLSYPELEIILVLPEAYRNAGQTIAREFEPMGLIRTIAGGKTRFESVQKGLSLVQEPSIVFVHDAVRCLLTPSLIHRCYDAAVATGSAVPAVESKDSIRMLDGKRHRAVPRKTIRMIQTPQTFRSEMLLPAYQTAYREEFTDDATVFEAAGYSVTLVEGEQNNIKLTTPPDLFIAERLLAPPQFRS